MVEDLEEGEVDGDSVSEGALLPGLMWVWEGEDCRGAATSSAELRECLSRRVIPLMVTLGVRLIIQEWPIRDLCHMVMRGHLWERIPMLNR